MNTKIVDLKTKVVDSVVAPVVEGFQEAHQLTRTIISSVSEAVSSFASHKSQDSHHNDGDRPLTPIR